MSNDNLPSPEEGELIVATVTSVKQNGAYVTLDEYPGTEGFIFIGEIASGWVKNIRGFVREGQRVICKVMKTRRDGSSLELSLKSVSEERRRDRLQEWKNEQRALQLLKVLGEKVGWTEEGTSQYANELTQTFGTLYSSFEEVTIHANALTNAGFEGDWIQDFIQLAVENIVPPFVQVRGSLTININASNGIVYIREALELAEALTDEEQEIDVKCYYDGAPQYRIELKAPDFKVAESIWEKATSAIVGHMKSAGGEAKASRE